MNFPEPASIQPATEADLPQVAELAGIIWRACYPGIISAEQIEFMLARMYALGTLRDEIQSKGVRFYLLQAGGRASGFASIGPTETFGVVMLHKLYLLPELHGRGLGSFLLKHCQSEARRMGARHLLLRVNKHNTNAMAAYQRNGFIVKESVVTDIGGGFMMDDFIMGKEL